MNEYYAVAIYDFNSNTIIDMVMCESHDDAINYMNENNYAVYEVESISYNGNKCEVMYVL